MQVNGVTCIIPLSDHSINTVNVLHAAVQMWSPWKMVTQSTYLQTTSAQHAPQLAVLIENWQIIAELVSELYHRCGNGMIS